MSIQSIEQERAKRALNWARDLSENGGINDELLSAARNMAPMILMNGIGQTAAFYNSKNKSAHTVLYDLLSDWLVQVGKPYEGAKDLLEGVTTLKEDTTLEEDTTKDVQTYRAAQAEALALLKWVQKFAKAYHTPTKAPKNTGQDDHEHG